MSALKHGARVTAVDALHAMGDPLWHFSGGAMFRYLVSTSSAKGPHLLVEMINSFTLLADAGFAETTISWSQWEYLCDILDSGPPKDGWLANIPADDGREGGVRVSLLYTVKRMGECLSVTLIIVRAPEHHFI